MKLFSRLIWTFSLAFSMELRFEDCNRGDSWDCRRIEEGQLSYTCFDHKQSETLNVSLQNLISSIELFKPSMVNAINLSDCPNLLVDMHLPKISTIKKLHISRVRELRILGCQDLARSPYHPADIILEDVAYIFKLHSGTITSPDTEDVIFRRVLIDQVEVGAITNPSGKQSLLLLESVNINVMSTESLVVTLDSEGVFRMIDSNVGRVSTNAVIVQGGAAQFSNSTFRDIDESGISISAEKFLFASNIVENRMSHLAITSPEITFQDNKYGSCNGSFQVLWESLIKASIREVRIINRDNSMCNVSNEEESCRIREGNVPKFMNCSAVLYESKDSCELGGNNGFVFDCKGFCVAALCSSSIILLNSYKLTLVALIIEAVQFCVFQ